MAAVSAPAGPRTVELIRPRGVRIGPGHVSGRFATDGFGKGWGWRCECGYGGSARRLSWAQEDWRRHRRGERALVSSW